MSRFLPLHVDKGVVVPLPGHSEARYRWKLGRAEAAGGTMAARWARWRGASRDPAEHVDLDAPADPAPVAQPEPDPIRAAELAAFRRACEARDEAIRDLRRLRARHWSGERLLEESMAPTEWWEHPDADPYAVLGLLPGARLEDASAARRRIALQCHPDRLGRANPEMALRRMVAANAAYDRLRRALIRV